MAVDWVEERPTHMGYEDESRNLAVRWERAQVLGKSERGNVLFFLNLGRL